MSCPNRECEWVRLINLSGPCAARSQSDRIRRLKNKANAAFANSEGFSAFTISQTSSTRLSVQDGRRSITTRDHYATETVTDAGCCSDLQQVQPALMAQADPTNVVAIPGTDAGTIDVSWTGDDTAYLVSAGDQFVIGTSPVTLMDLVAGTYTITVGSVTTTLTI